MFDRIWLFYNEQAYAISASNDTEWKFRRIVKPRYQKDMYNLWARSFACFCANLKNENIAFCKFGKNWRYRANRDHISAISFRFYQFWKVSFFSKNCSIVVMFADNQAFCGCAHPSPNQMFYRIWLFWDEQVYGTSASDETELDLGDEWNSGIRVLHKTLNHTLWRCPKQKQQSQISLLWKIGQNRCYCAGKKHFCVISKRIYRPHFWQNWLFEDEQAYTVSVSDGTVRRLSWSVKPRYLGTTYNLWCVNSGIRVLNKC